MKQQEKKHLEKFLIILTFFLLIFVFGIFLNNLSLTANNGKMPFLFNDMYSYIETSTHFCYTDKNEINLWYLSDIFLVGKSKFLMLRVYSEGVIFSIGDFFMIMGFFGSMFSFGALLSYRIGFYFEKLSRLKRAKKGGKKEDDKRRGRICI